MRDAARAELDRVDELAPGQGMLEAYLYGGGDFKTGEMGGAVDYSHRLRENLSAFAHGEVGYRYGTDKGLGWRAMAGLRGRF